MAHRNKAMLRGKEDPSSGDEKGNQSHQPNACKNSSNAGIGSKHDSIATSKKELLRELPEDFEPGEFDVVCSRGKWAMTLPGNVRYKAIIKDNLKKYSDTASKQEKSAIVSEIVDSIQALSPEGGFVRSVNGRWFTVTDHIAREKTGQSFRDLLHEQYRSSTKAKRRRHKQRHSTDAPSMLETSPLKWQDQEFDQSSPPSPSSHKDTHPTLAMHPTLAAPGGQDNTRADSSDASTAMMPGIASSLSGAASQVFPNIPAQMNLPNSLMGAQLAQHYAIQYEQMLNFSSVGNMAAAAQQRHHVHHPFTFDVNHMHQSFPIHNDFAHPHGSYPAQHQEQQITMADLEPTPIPDASLPSFHGLLQPNPHPHQHSEQTQLLAATSGTGGIFNPLHNHGSAMLPSELLMHLQHPEQQQQQHLPHINEQQHLTRMHEYLQSSQHIQQHPQPQALGHPPLEPLPFHQELDDPPGLPDWDARKHGTLAGIRGESSAGFESRGRYMDHNDYEYHESDQDSDSS